MNYAVTLAGGTGSRVGGDVPKQLLVMGGCTVLEHSVGAFGNAVGAVGCCDVEIAWQSAERYATHIEVVVFGGVVLSAVVVQTRSQSAACKEHDD